MRFNPQNGQFNHFSNGVIFLFFLISPIISMIWVIKGCVNRRWGFYFIIALFVGLAGLLIFPPIGDQYRHALEYYSLKGHPLSDYFIQNFVTGKIDFALPLLKYCFGSFDLPFGFIRAMLVMISALLFLDLYDRFKYNGVNDGKYVLLLIFLIFPMNAICSGMRYGFGTCLLAYVFCNRIYLNRKRLIDPILIILSVCFHTGCIILIMIYLLSRLIVLNLSKHTFIVISIITLIVSGTISSLLLYVPLPYPLNEYVSEYLQGKYTDSGYITENLNFIGITKTYFMLYAPILTIIYYNLKSYHSDRKSSFYNLLVLSWFATTPLFSINGRILIMTIIMGGFNLIIYAKKKDLKRAVQILSLILVLLILSNWRMVSSIRLTELFLPFPIGLHSDYDETWILNNVNDDGIFRPYW